MSRRPNEEERERKAAEDRRVEGRRQSTSEDPLLEYLFLEHERLNPLNNVPLPTAAQIQSFEEENIDPTFFDNMNFNVNDEVLEEEQHGEEEERHGEEEEQHGEEEEHGHGEEEFHGPHIPEPRVRLQRGRREKSGSGFTVRVRNTQGVVTSRRLTVQQTHNLPDNERVMLEYFGTTGQPLFDAGVLFNRFCISIGKMVHIFPIDPVEWRKVGENLKKHGWTLIEKKFEVNENLKGYAYGKMGYGWKEMRNGLFDTRWRKGARPIGELYADIPPGVPEDQWRRLCDWKVGPLGRLRSERGVKARAALDVKHTTGSRSFAVGLGEMAKDAAEKGIQTNLFRDFFTEAYTRPDGTVLTEQAQREIARVSEAAREMEAQTQESQGETASSQDPFTQVAAIIPHVEERRHHGRVKGLGFGARPTQVFRSSPGGPSVHEVGSTSGTSSQPFEQQQQQRRVEERERAVAENERAVAERERAVAEHERAMAEQFSTMEQQQRVMAEQQRAMEDRQRAMEEQQRAIAEQQQALAQMLAEAGARRRRRSPISSDDDR